MAIVVGAGVVAVVGIALAWALFTLAGRLRDLEAARAAPDAAVALLQREIQAVRGEARQGQESTLQTVRQDVTQFGGQVGQQLGQLQTAVTTQLQQVTAEVNRRLQEAMGLIQSAQSAMGQRLDQAAVAVSQVHGQLGTLTEATRRMEQVGRDIAGLEQILRAPKVRGGLGEILLERLLEEILPGGSYRLQHAFRGGDRVDAVIVLGDRLVPVDSKFPLENFRRLVEEPEEDRRRVVRRAFARDVRNRVDEIAKKYILPDEGTFDFALMYIPAENVYYEVIVQDGDEADEDALLTYALSRRVIPVSPNSFYAYLQVILLGLKGLRIEQNAREILATLGRLTGDLARFREHFDTLGKHVTNAKNKYEEAATALARFEAKLENVEGRGVQEALPGVGS
ncbi:MAG TPA: DNA recombination protein RmuC [Methylomirabilota bacterium]|nr:DNA recombination protein RmuC [Methylomirabilota bacterium]